MSGFVPSALSKYQFECLDSREMQRTASQMEAAISAPWRFFRANCNRLMRLHVSTWARVSVLGRIARNPKKLSSLNRERGNFRDLQGRRIHHHADRRTGHLGMAVPALRQRPEPPKPRPADRACGHTP